MTTPGLPSTIAVVGLGYVGLPLAVAFARELPTIGLDVDTERVRQLQSGLDGNGEVQAEHLMLPNLTLTNDPALLEEAEFLIVAVPTPVDHTKRPDLQYLVGASRLIGERLKPGAIVVYESTVYPGCTEEACIPVLEEASGLKAGVDFGVGYSPERINPGDGTHGLGDVVKIVSAQDAETLARVAKVYELVAKAGVYRAPNIKTAEGAKVIENIQRDQNIAFVNELAMLCHGLGLDTHEVLAAAQTKWNFLPFHPGLVGGHCIPVDPYYLAHKAMEVGYQPEMILAGRHVNDQMGFYVAREAVKLMIEAGKAVQQSSALVLGVAFKENVRDVRNSKVVDLVREMESFGVRVVVYDPLVDDEKIRQLGLTPIDDPFAARDNEASYDAVVLAVPHKLLLEHSADDYLGLIAKGGVLVDLRGVLPSDYCRERSHYWRL